MERERFLGRVAEALAVGSLPPAPPEDPGLLVPDLPELDLVETFAAALRAVDGTLHRGQDPVEVIMALARREQVREAICWEAGLPVDGIGDALAARGIRLEGSAGDGEELARLRLGVTGAEAAFAQSGTVVVRSGPGQPRMASLIPPVHLVLLPSDRIHRSLSHWAAEHAGSMADVSNVVLITGPSRTADIEQQLNLGVHGPAELHVVLLE